jgi:hypothetical protein
VYGASAAVAAATFAPCADPEELESGEEPELDDEPDPEELQAAADTTATTETQAAAALQAVRRFGRLPVLLDGLAGPGSPDPLRAPLPPHRSPIFASIFTLLGSVKERCDAENSTLIPDRPGSSARFVALLREVNEPNQ